MKAITSPNNKQVSKIPHKNTLETKTIRSKSWIYALFNKKHTPAIALVVAGFLIGLVPPAQAIISERNENDSKQTVNTDSQAAQSSTEENHQQEKNITSEEPKVSSNPKNTITTESSSETSISGSKSVNIRTEVHSSQNNSNNNGSDTTVHVNGTQIEPDSRGRIKEDFKDDNNDVRIRGKVDSNNTGNNNTSIDISTKSSIKP